MKKIIVILLFLYSLSTFGQENNIKKPEYVIIAYNEIISNEKLEEYGEKGLIKAVNKGVTEEERNKLAKKFGAKIGDREFIIKVDLLNKQEKIDRDKLSNSRISTTNSNKSENELKLNINAVARDFTVEMIDGQKITLSELKGKVVLINYWATWCAPCLMEFTEIPEKIISPFKDKGFVFIPIAIGEDIEKVEKKMLKMKKYGVVFNAGVDPKKEIWNKYATGSIPKNFLIDQNGVVKYISIGNSEGSLDKLALEIDKLIKK